MDITMCNFSCPLSKECFRHEAKPNDFWQAYFSEEPWRQTSTKEHKLTQKELRSEIVDPTEFKCSYFWSIKER